MEENTQSEGLQFFDSTEALNQTTAQESPTETVEEIAQEPVQETEPVQEEYVQEEPQESEYVDPEAAPQAETYDDSEEDYSDEEIEAAVYTYLSERLGYEVNSF